MQAAVRTTENCVFSGVFCHLPRHLSVFVCRAFGRLGPSLCLFLSSPPPPPPPLSPSLSLSFCQSSQDFRWNDAVTKRARQRLPDMPSQVFVFRGPPPYHLLLLFFLLHHHHRHLPRILENRKCILLSDGWAPCSC